MGASRVQIAKLKVAKDKWGIKYCRVSILRTVDESDRDTPAVAAAIQHMMGNQKVTKVAVGMELRACSLTFYGAPETKPSERFPAVEAFNFRLKREKPGSVDTSISLAFDFNIPLVRAKEWIIPAIGDDILCVIDREEVLFRDASA